MKKIDEKDPKERGFKPLRFKKYVNELLLSLHFSLLVSNFT